MVIISFGLKRKCVRNEFQFQASLFAQMGYDGLFFARLDYQDKNKRLNTSNMETIWQASANLDESNSLFTGAMFDFYNSPRNFCFDILCSDEPIINDKNSEDYNVDRRVRFVGIFQFAPKIIWPLILVDRIWDLCQEAGRIVSNE